MLVSRVSPVKFNINNVIPSSLDSTRNHACNPSFGYLYPTWAKNLIDRHLPPARRRLFDGELMEAVNASNPQKATNKLMSKALLVAIVNMVVTSLKQATHFMNGLVL